MRAAVALVLVASCGHRDELVVTSPARPHPTRPQPAPPVSHAAPVTAPHGGRIVALALADEGDVAMSADQLGELRLWPSLDGTRPPVVVTASPATALAIAHAGDELVAAIRDEVGGIELVRLARDGATLGRVQLRDDAAVVDMVAAGAGVLALRADQSIARYDATGERGRIVAQPGERIVSIAARHGAALAVIAGEDGTATAIRWIVVDGGALRWGTAITLPDAITRAVALSPSHRRLAAQSAKEPGKVFVFDLAPVKRVAELPIATPTDRTIVGFGDDGHVAAVGNTIAWNAVAKSTDPWERTAPAHPPATSEVAIGDGVAITGWEGSLVLSDPARTRYLGYDELATGTLANVGDRFAISPTGVKVTWLDDHLGLTRTASFNTIDAQVSWGTPFGDRHAIVQRRAGNRMRFELWNLDHPHQSVELDSFEQVQRFEVANDAGVFTVVLQNGDVERFAIDVVHDKVTRLAKLATGMSSVQQLRLLDPARADGAVAVVVGYKQAKTGATTGPFLQVYRDGQPPTETTLVNAPLAIDARGALWTIEVSTQQDDGAPTQMLVVARGGKEVMRFDMRSGVTALVPSVDRVAVVRGGTEVLVFDAAGKQLWTRSQWGASQIVFSSDGRSLVVQTPGGIVELDAATGARLAVACGWSFGLHDIAPQAGSFSTTPACVDPDA